jgi:hypothetical protein
MTNGFQGDRIRKYWLRVEWLINIWLVQIPASLKWLDAFVCHFDDGKTGLVLTCWTAFPK